LIVTVDQMLKQWGMSGADAVFWTRMAANTSWFGTIIIAMVFRTRWVVIAALTANLVFIIYWLLR
jgi:hypothetical protein